MSSKSRKVDPVYDKPLNNVDNTGQRDRVIVMGGSMAGLAAARFPASVRRRYERMERFPEGYLVLGDAISSFNPVYGQGMSVASLETVELGRVLREGSAKIAPRFFTQAAKIVDAPWSMAAGSDLRMPEVAGSRTPMVRFLNWYIAKVHLGTRHDSALAMTFQNVVNLLALPQSLFEPRLIIRVLSAMLARQVSGNKSLRLETAAREAV